ncbi:MAG: flagellar biosynthetic protein FliR [Parvularculaceae bacterium]|nr:flagellar biosynthetic protein FliR [Parvularculaceae bacterium]
MEFLDALAPLASLTDAPIAIFAGVFMRLSALVFFLPGLGEQAVSARVRLGAAIAGALVLTPVVMAGKVAAPETPALVLQLLVAEALSGAVIGFSIRVAVFALQMAGVIIAQTLSLSQAFDAGLNGEAEPAMATLLMLAGVALAVTSGLHFEAIRALALSYEVMPFGAFPGAADAGSWAADRAGFAFAAALGLSLPFVMLAYIYNLAIGAANRAMPMLSVSFIGAPAITLASLVLLAVSAVPILTAWMKIMSASLVTLTGNAP